MALAKQTLTLISIFALLFSTIYAKETSSPSPKSSPASSPSTLSHLFDKLPSFGIKKLETPGKGANVVTKQLQAMEKQLEQKRVDDMYTSVTPDLPEPKRKCFAQCGDNLQSAAGHARESIALVGKPDFAKAKVEINAVCTDVDKCYNCFKDAKIDEPGTTSLHEWVKGVTGDCLKSLQA